MISSTDTALATLSYSSADIEYANILAHLSPLLKLPHLQTQEKSALTATLLQLLSGLKIL